ncbi:uncharacterized protein BX664DRAFT_319473 [Halteromyces radiatus]|uniref:uncharacterized protein n=1 Tax=Halteromyces radiatus TaxID=101107 RepID=UPI00221F9C5F|nr:uncharacterized protein BX664DRAFT_319473 [Halteromyces radiatus]KAI8098743.1 hypothetical protein BX664DRAFT_319473 [Halteromyces radiatus]
MYQRPHHTSLKNINNNATQSPMVTTTTFSQLPSSAMHNQPPSPVGAAVTTKSTSVYEKKYQHPSLSAEKVECIDAWRQSLSELMASDPQLRLSSPPPIESIPDDDQISVISDMTSISHRQPHLRRRISIASSSSKRSIRSNKVKPRDQQKVSPQLKKKRSNDVKNWIEPRKMDSHGNIIGSSPIGLPPIDTYQVAYFQDCKTTARSSSSGSLHLDHDDTQQKEVQNKNTTTVMLDRHAKYHNSTRAKQIQIVDVQHSPITPQQQSIDITTTSSSCRPRSNSSAQQSKFVSPSDNFPPTRRSLDNNNNNSNTDSTIRSPPTSMLAESPLYSLAHVDSKNQDEEEISLADLQRSLKRASLQHHQQRTVSSSSLPASTQNQQYNHRHSYTHHHPQHQPYHSSVSVAAPAVPPVPYNNHLGMISRASILSGTTPQYAEPELDQQEEKWKKQQRSRSWMPSCEQQKIIQQRRSFQLDTTHW